MKTLLEVPCSFGENIYSAGRIRVRERGYFGFTRSNSAGLRGFAEKRFIGSIHLTD